MATNYPGSLDDFATTSPSNLGDDDSKGRTHSERHNDMESAMEAVQGELGTDPAGAQATVKERLEALQWWGSASVATWSASSGWAMTATNVYTGSTVTASANVLYYVPFWCPLSVTLDRIQVEVTIQQSSANARLGIYSSTAAGMPDSRVLDGGEIDCSATGLKALTISQALSGGQLYWLALLNETASVAYRASGREGTKTVGSDGSLSYGLGAFNEAETYTDGLPATAATTLAMQRDAPLFWLRRS